MSDFLQVEFYLHAEVGTALLHGAATAAAASEAAEATEAAATKVETTTEHAVQDVVQVEVAESTESAATAG